MNQKNGSPLLRGTATTTITIAPGGIAASFLEAVLIVPAAFSAWATHTPEHIECPGGLRQGRDFVDVSNGMKLG